MLSSNWDADFSLQVMDYLRRSADLFDENPNASSEFAIKLINAKKYELADEVLELARSRHEKGLTRNPFSVGYYLLNKAQIKRHQSIPLAAEEIREIETLLKLADDPSTRFGCFLVLGKYEAAEAEFTAMINSHLFRPEELARMLTWPIVRLMPNDSIRRIANFLTGPAGTKKSSNEAPPSD